MKRRSSSHLFRWISYGSKDRGTFMVSATVQEGSKRGQVLGTGEAIECALHYVNTGDGVRYRVNPVGPKKTG